jgi:hypothetical protein
LGFLNYAPAEGVLRRFEEQWGRPPDPHRSTDDVWLLSLDEARVWSDDPEADAAGNQVYCEVLAELSAIAGGVFEPSRIEEYWETDEGPILVSFWLANKQYVVDPFFQDDWLDLTILLQLNHLIAPSGKQFVCAGDVNHAIVFVTDDETRKVLEEIRRFPFNL